MGGGGRGVYRGLLSKPEGKRPLGRDRHRREDNIKIFSGRMMGAWTRSICLTIGTGGGFVPSSKHFSSRL